jgi:hypothetical protein
MCPQNCTASSFDSTLLSTCYDDCIDNGGTVDSCVTNCNACVITNTCWTEDSDYWKADDHPCTTDCFFSSCTTKFGSSSSLCDCSAHGKCVFGCPENCNTASYSFTTTDVGNCMELCAIAPNSMTEVECANYCGKCFEKYNCLSEMTLGSSEDSTCKTNCFDTCDSTLGAESYFCDCSHGFCNSQCK